MTTMMRWPLRLLALMLLSISALHAQEAPGAAALDLGKLRSEQQALRPQIESAQGRYADMPRKQRKALLDRQAELLALIEGRQQLAELGPEQRAAVQNALQALVAAESGPTSDRLVCKRVKSIGSHRMTTVCQTPEEAAAQAEATQHGIDRVRSACTGNAGGLACTQL